MKLPAGVSAAEFSGAIAEFERVVGGYRLRRFSISFPIKIIIAVNG